MIQSYKSFLLISINSFITQFAMKSSNTTQKGVSMQQTKKVKQQGVMIGHTLFTKQFAQQIFPTLQKLPPLLKNQNKQIWYFRNHKQEMIQFEYAIESECQKLVFWSKREHPLFKVLSEIIPAITHIIFSNIKSLKINNLCITSVEGLSFLHMQNLQALQISQNLITCFKPMQKTNWKNLHSIVSFANKTTQQKLNRTKMNNHESQGLIEIFVEDFCHWIKIQMENFSRFNVVKIRNQKMINYRRNQAIMRKRFQKGQIKSIFLPY